MEQRAFIDIYCQKLINTIDGDMSLTNLADLIGDVSHDTLNKHLSLDEIGPADVWERVKGKIEQNQNGVLALDDTVIEKTFSEHISLVYWLFSAGAIILGIGIIFLLYINPKNKKIWVIDFRIYNKNKDRKTKMQHAKEMLSDATNEKKIQFKYVTMDKWYGSYELMHHIDGLGKIYYCPLKNNRSVKERPDSIYTPVQNLKWSDYEWKYGKRDVKLRNFPKEKLVTIFQIFPTAEEVAYLVTNDSKEGRMRKLAFIIYKMRWKIELLHRELKQFINIANCQCRKERIQRNHIACCAMAWNFLRNIAYETNQTLRALKKSMRREVEIYLLKNPKYKFA
jgi:hypothetical protein